MELEGIAREIGLSALQLNGKQAILIPARRSDAFIWYNFLKWVMALEKKTARFYSKPEGPGMLKCTAVEERYSIWLVTMCFFIIIRAHNKWPLD